MSLTVVDPQLLPNKPNQALWIRYIMQRIRENKNFIGIVSGPTGSGKSWSSLSMGEQADPNFNINRVVFSGAELMRLINSGTLKKGSAIVFEEAGIGMSSKSWQSVTNKLLNFLIQTFRHRNFILIFNTPYMDFVDASTRKLFHAEFNTQSVDIVNGTCRLKPRYIQYNSRNKKFYFKRLKVITKCGKRPVDTWSISRPSPELVKEYEIKKRAFTDKLNASIQNDLMKLEEKDDNKPQSKLGELTHNQQGILDLLNSGMSTQEIADEQEISVVAVNKHIRTLRKKGYSVKAVRDKGNNNRVTHYIVESPEPKLLKTENNKITPAHDNLTRQDSGSSKT
jgi:biotin operon repressor